MHQLGSYVRFFNILRDLESAQQIDNKQKQLLKINFTTKEIKLMAILEELDEEDEEELKFSLINYLAQFKLQKPVIQRQSKRARSSITDIAPLRQQQRQESPEMDEEQILKDLEQANNLLMNIYQQKKNGNFINRRITELTSNMAKLFQNASTPKLQRQQSRQSSIISEINLSAEYDLADAYKSIKLQFTQYLHSHLLLMDENVSYDNIFSLLLELLKHLLDCDHFSFIVLQTEQIEVYQSSTDQMETQPISEEITSEIESMPQDRMFEISTQSTVANIIQVHKYFKSHCFLSNKVLVVFHQINAMKDSNETYLINTINEYQRFDEIRQLAKFLTETVTHAKVQFFSPLSIADMILDIGISFVRCSKYLLIESMYKILQKYYTIEKMLLEPGDQISHEPDYTQILFHDSQLRVVFKIMGMNLNKVSDQRVFVEVKQYYEKYLRFIRQCYDKSAFYKFFLRSNDSLIFEFDKSGHLVFLSRPVPQQIKEDFNITFNTEIIQKNLLSYSKIFDSQIIANIENYLQDENWKMKQDNNQQYEIFIKIEEKNYKGFVVIFSENKQGWIKDQLKTLASNHPDLDEKIQAKIRKQIIQHETINFVNKLEQNNPEMKNSVASLYIPQSSTKKLIQSSTHIIIPDEIIQPPTRRSEMPHCKSRFQQFQQFNIGSLCLEEGDDIVDSFDFNALVLQNQFVKHRAVWAILKKNNFIDEYSIPADNLQKFIEDIEYHYNVNSNPYHNYDHGLNVMQMAHYLCIQMSQTAQGTILDQFQRFVLIVSSFSHDVGHTGRTNLFEIHSLSDLAVRYHDKSVLEQHHASLTIQILKNPQSNILVNLTQDEFRNFRKGLIYNILSTDMQEHFGLLKDFESRQADFHDAKMLSALLIHISDFAGAVKKFPISQQWSARVNQEFIRQFQIEGELGYPQQPYMKDLDKPTVMAKSEIGFLKVIVRPGYLLLSNFLEGRLANCLQNVDETLQNWEKMLRKAEEQQNQIIQ